MKKLSKYKSTLKKIKRPSFHFYLVLFVVCVTFFAVGLSSFFSDLMSRWLKVSSPLFILSYSLIIAWILSFFIGRVLLKPIENIQNAMHQVTQGDLNINLEEKSKFEEIENIYHSFNIMMKELRSTQAMQKDFISNVSHEFKTPLNAIEGYATILQDSTLSDEEREECIKEILSTTKEMTDLIVNILLLSKVNNHAIDYKKEDFSLDEQLRKVVVMLEPMWAQKNIEFDVDFEEIIYCGHEGLMQNVWRNLIENAIKFTPYNSKIKLTLHKIDSNIIFTVSDEGEGIKEEEKDLIFNKFYQSDTSHKQEGNGLGLPLAKEILNVFNGNISVENLTPRGCKFTVTISI